MQNEYITITINPELWELVETLSDIGLQAQGDYSTLSQEEMTRLLDHCLLVLTNLRSAAVQPDLFEVFKALADDMLENVNELKQPTH